MTEVAPYPRRNLNALSENPKMEKDRYDRRNASKRKQLRLRFYCNGDRFFKSKRVCLDPKAHNSFQDLLNSISLMMPVELYLRNGVQRIYTPSNGTRVQSVEQLIDGGDYVLAGNETFKAIKYGTRVLEPWGKGQSQSNYKTRFAGRYGPTSVAPDESNYVGYNAFPPSRFYRQVRSNKFPPYFPAQAAPGGRRDSTAAGGAGAGFAAAKPKVITVVQAGGKTPRKLIKVLLNRRSVQPFEQLMSDVCEQFVQPAAAPVAGPGDSKMFTVHGREVQGISDFFRDEDVFIWASPDRLAGHVYGPGLLEVRELLLDLFWDKEWKIPTLMKEWERRTRRAERQRRKQQQEQLSQAQHPPQAKRTALVPAQKGAASSAPFGSTEEDKRDSGFDESEPAAASHASEEAEEARLTQRGGEFLPKIDVRESGDRSSGRSVEEERRRHGLPLLRPSGTSSRDLRRQMQQRALKDKLERRALRRQQAAELERQRVARAEAEEVQAEAEAELRERREAAREAREAARREAAEKVKRSEARRKKEEEEAAAARRLEEERRLQAEAEAEAERRRKAGSKASESGALTQRLSAVRETEGSGDASEAEAEAVQETEQREEEERRKEEARKRAEAEEAVRLEEERRKREEAEEMQRRREEEAAAAQAEEARRLKEEEAKAAEERRRKREAAEAAARRRMEEAEKRRREEEEEAAAATVEEQTAREKAEKERQEKEKEKEKEADKENNAEAAKEKEAEAAKEKEAEAAKKAKRTRRPPGLRIQKQFSRSDHILERYDLGKVIGDGNFAVVRTCRKKDSGNEYAMKIIDKAKLRGRESMVENEIDLMHACNHPNLVKLKEEYETPTEIFLVMELVKGGDLFDAITQSVKFSEPQSALMVNDLSQALFYLHSRMIVHRDLKPENLLVVRNKNGSLSLKLADFGLAMEVKRLIYTVCGTPTYVAPEILEEKGYGLEVDLWALGVITYILLCGFPPFRSPDRKQTELFEMIRSGRFEFLSPYWDTISSSAKDLISHLLVVDRKRRYSSIDVLCHPWVVSVASTAKLGQPLNEYRQNLRRSLESRARLELQEFRASRAADAAQPVPA